MKLLAGFVILGLVSASSWANQKWYNAEIVHNAVHSLEEVVERFPNTKEISPAIKAALEEFKKAVSHLHDEMSDNDKEKDAKIITEAFQTLQAPLERFVAAVRRNQIEVKDSRPHLYDTLAILDTYGELKFWMTKVE